MPGPAQACHCMICAARCRLQPTCMHSWHPPGMVASRKNRLALSHEHEHALVPAFSALHVGQAHSRRRHPPPSRKCTKDPQEGCTGAQCALPPAVLTRGGFAGAFVPGAAKALAPNRLPGQPCIWRAGGSHLMGPGWASCSCAEGLAVGGEASSSSSSSSS